MRIRNAVALAAAALAPGLVANSCAAAADPGRASTGRVETAERPRVVRADATVELALGETVALEGSGRTLRFARVAEDSRCPREVTCVWAGRAVVEIAIAESGGRPATTSLVVGSPAPADAAAGALRLTALALEPYPRASAATRPEDYRLRLAIANAGAPPPGAR